MRDDDDRRADAVGAELVGLRCGQTDKRVAEVEGGVGVGIGDEAVRWLVHGGDDRLIGMAAAQECGQPAPAAVAVEDVEDRVGVVVGGGGPVPDDGVPFERAAAEPCGGGELRDNSVVAAARGVVVAAITDEHESHQVPISAGVGQLITCAAGSVASDRSRRGCAPTSRGCGRAILVPCRRRAR